MHNQTVQQPSGADRAPEATGPESQPSPAAARPVFVDPSGRRQRRVRRLGRLLAIPAAGYVALLLSAAIGGPSVDSPYLPLPAGGDRTAATTEHTPGAGAPAHRKSAAPAAGAHTARPVRSTTAGVPSSAPVGAARPAPTTAAPSPTAAPAPTHGKSTATHPTPTHTGHGH